MTLAAPSERYRAFPTIPASRSTPRTFKGTPPTLIATHRMTMPLRSDLSCIGLVTTASEVVQDLSGRGRDTGFGGDLLAAEGDRGGPQRPQRLHDLFDRHPGAGLGLARHRERGEHDGEVGFDAVA